MSNADHPAMQSPSGSLAGFPATILSEGRPVARTHSPGRNPWWFASAPATNGGRFDLDAPMGTCYVADTVEVAVRERLRETLLAAGMVTSLAADSFEISIFRVPKQYRCAHIGVSRAAGFGVTGELASLSPNNYSISRQWAMALNSIGFDGIRYSARFTPGRANAWAVFGQAGADQRPQPIIESTVSGQDACRQCGIKVMPIPSMSSLSVIG